MALIERPYEYSYSKNEIRYVFQLANLERVNLYLQVRLIYKKLSETVYTQLYVFDLKPTNTGLVYFYIQGYLDSVVNYSLPQPGTVVNAADDQARNFYIEYREITDDDPNPDFVTTESSQVRIVIKGGVEKNKFHINNVFANYLQTQKVFLTWNPPGHFIFYSENVFISFLNPTPGSALQLKLNCVSVTNVTHTQTININGTALIYHLNISPLLINYAYLNATDTYYFEASITNAAGTTTLINPYRFFMEYRPIYKYYDLVYFNSLGGVSGVRVSGETSVAISRDYDEIEGGMNLDWTSNFNAAETTYINIRLQRQYKGDIGYLRNRTKKEQESFIELLATQNIYQLINQRWIPVIGLQKSVDLGTNKATRQSFPIEWSLSETNDVYTPEKSSW